MKNSSSKLALLVAAAKTFNPARDPRQMNHPLALAEVAKYIQVDDTTEDDCTEAANALESIASTARDESKDSSIMMVYADNMDQLVAAVRSKGTEVKNTTGAKGTRAGAAIMGAGDKSTRPHHTIPA